MYGPTWWSFPKPLNAQLKWTYLAGGISPVLPRSLDCGIRAIDVGEPVWEPLLTSAGRVNQNGTEYC